MMYRYLSLLFVFFLVFIYACNQQKQSAKVYHKEIKTTIDTIIPYFISLDDDIALDSISKIHKHYESLEKIVINANEYIASKDAYQNENEFYQSAKSLIQFYKDYTQKDIKNILEKLEKDPTNVDLKEQARIIFIHFYEKEQFFLNQFHKTSVDFSYKYKIYQIKNEN